MSKLDNFVKQFLAESHENLDTLDRTLIELEKDPGAADKLADIFRTVHSLKGTASFFGYLKLGALAHCGESLMSRLRDGSLLLSSEITSGLLAMVDAVRRILSNIEKAGDEGAEEYTALIEKLTSLYQSDLYPSESSPNGAPASPSVLTAEELEESDSDLSLGELVMEPDLMLEQEMSPARNEHPKDALPPAGEIVAPAKWGHPVNAGEALTAQEPYSFSPPAGNVRIDVEHLDRLMDLVGELVLARNQILQFSMVQEDAGFLGATQRLNLITTGLQEGIMNARLQPIENIWSKFPRVVRDLAVLFGKQVRLETDGSNTELDRTIIEAIRAPFMHLVRNCVDHGIETPAKRAAAGKPSEGLLFLRAFHEGGQVNIEISDDGAGIDPRLLKHKAIELGMITSEQAQQMDEQTALNLVFMPGFSTAEKVTDISGRGVGMDVVKTNIEKIGGMVDIESKLGKGTMVKIRIPLTLAIIPALIVASGKQRYAIPQTSVLELVMLADGKAARGIELVHGSPVYRLRENLLPLVYLDKELAVQSAMAEAANAQSGDAVVNIVVLQADNQKFGLVVDEVNDTGEIVVKPLGKALKGIPTFVGATVMGDGRVALILDVVGLARRARVLSPVNDLTHVATPLPSRQGADDRQSLILFTTSGQALMAIPLSQVTRLEEFPRASLEWTGAHEVVQHQGKILPLIDVCSLLPGGGTLEPRSSKEAATTIQVVVYEHKHRRAGLIVGRLLDIVEERFTIQFPPARKGSLGSAVIHGQVVEILDVEEIINMTMLPHEFEERTHTDGKKNFRELTA
ncbi:MAG TPA: chemotaxis protein CheA [Candidatus Angelobacter sp.]|nr:chemotaxis protein CheA [Candidatus Angelobacter sp.]